jgi:hypothetical protein
MPKSIDFCDFFGQKVNMSGQAVFLPKSIFYSNFGQNQIICGQTLQHGQRGSAG